MRDPQGGYSPGCTTITALDDIPNPQPGPAPGSGTRQSDGEHFERLKGECPMGCGQTLFVSAGGYITCSYLQCPRPDAVSTLLEDCETEHIVQLDGDTFSVRHPLRERLDDALLDCDLGAYLADLDGPPRRPGRYRASEHDGRWVFEALI